MLFLRILYRYSRVLASTIAGITFFSSLLASGSIPGDFLGIIRSPWTWLSMVVVAIGIVAQLPPTRYRRWRRAVVTVHDTAGATVGYGFVVSTTRILTSRSVADAAAADASEPITVRFPHVRTPAGDLQVQVHRVDTEDQVTALEVDGIRRLPRRVLPLRFNRLVPATNVLLYDPHARQGDGAWVEAVIGKTTEQTAWVSTANNRSPIEAGRCVGVPMVGAISGHLLGMCVGGGDPEDGDHRTSILMSGAFERLNTRISAIKRSARAVAEIVADPAALLRNWVVGHAIPAVGIGVVLAVVLTYLVLESGEGGASQECVELNVTSSTEKDDLVKRRAAAFSKGRKVGGRCVRVRVLGLTSGAAMEALAADWDPEVVESEVVESEFEQAEPGRNRPNVWLPTSSMWPHLLKSNRNKKYRDLEDLGPITESVMAIAVPHGTAAGEDVSMKWLKAMAKEPDFVLGRDEPLWSTSGLGASVLTYDAARRETSNDEEALRWVRELESSVGSYGDEATKYLLDLYCGIVEPVDALVIQEQLARIYNSGRPSGAKPDCAGLPGYHESRHPQIKKLDSYVPRQGTLLMDHPYVMMPGMSDAQKDVAAEFYEFLRTEDSQDAFVTDGFRRIGSTEKSGTATLAEPRVEDLERIRAEWDGVRKKSQVILLLDNSDSMTESVEPGESKIDHVKAAAKEAIRLLAPDDELAVWTFGDTVKKGVLRPVGQDPKALEDAIDAIRAGSRTTQLPTAVQAAHDALTRTESDADNKKTKAIVLLTDGKTNVAAGGSDKAKNRQANDTLVADIEDSESHIRIYTIPYGKDADQCLLQRLAVASGSRYYGASTNESLISDVMLAVFGNFGTHASAEDVPSIQAKARVPAGDC